MIEFDVLVKFENKHKQDSHIITISIINLIRNYHKETLLIKEICV